MWWIIPVALIGLCIVGCLFGCRRGMTMCHCGDWGAADGHKRDKASAADTRE